MSTNRRVVITGMSINTPLGDSLDGFYAGLLAGRSALSLWRRLDTSAIYSKVGADLTSYDVDAKLRVVEKQVSPEIFRRLRKLLKTAPWSTRLSLLVAIDAWLDAGLDRSVADGATDPTRIATIVAGHNINFNYQYETRLQFSEDPEYMDPFLALSGLDTDHASSISELLQLQGPLYTVGSACASGNNALRCAVDEVRHHDVDCALVTGAAVDFSPAELQSMALMGTIACHNFNDDPPRASRPYDTRREGFVPAHGAGTLVIEPLELALRRGARIYAEIIGIEANSDGNHLPQPSLEGQSRLMRRLLEQTGVAPEQIDYISAHATSTQLGDLTEIRSIKKVFGPHAYRLKVNATKSMLGHTCWSAPIVETVAMIMQLRSGRLHPSINIDELDPEVDLDVCCGRVVEHPVRYALKNSFGFGGINCVAVFKRWEAC